MTLKFNVLALAKGQERSDSDRVWFKVPLENLKEN